MAYVDENLNDPSLFFETLTWTGDGNTPRSLTGLDFQPNMIWSKRRDDAAGHNLLDSVRGAGTNSELCPSSNGIEGSNAAETYGYLSAFTSDGFTVTAGSSDNAYWNNNTATYVAWCWKESATAGFDIVSYTGNATARDISHSLSAVPKTMFIKNRSTAGAWMVYHESLGYNSGTIPRFLQLDNTNAQNNGGSGDFPADPTSSVFKVGTYDTMNKNTDSIIAYLWSEKQGFSKFGTYTGNGSTDGPFIYTGFRPAMVIAKEKSGTGHWRVRDNKRSTYNPVGIVSHANATTADTTEDDIDFLSNGFKLYTSGGENNGSGDTYCYWAFAEAPFVNSNGVPCNAR